MKLTCSKAGARAVRALSLVHVAALIAVVPIAAADAGTQVVQLRPTVIAQLPHDDTAFTEGLSLDGASLFESTGLEGQSQLRELDPTTGLLRRSATLPPSYFGEGIAAVGDRIWQLTYRNGVAIEWDRATLSRRREVPLTGEGWGLCLAGDHLVRSDGTAHLHLHDPSDMHETGMITATLNGTELSGLNGLDCVGNQIWANVFPTNRIVRIDAPTGAVTGVVDVEGLLDPKLADNIHILNGITHVDDTQFLITGKDWPNMYRVTFDPA